MRVLQFFGGGIFVADPTTYDPLEILLNTEDEDERNELTTRWRDNKLSELSFVGVVVRTGSLHFVSRGGPSYLGIHSIHGWKTTCISGDALM
jgi:hypothetical protein